MFLEVVVSLTEVVTPAVHNVRSKRETPRAEEEGRCGGTLRGSMKTMWHTVVAWVLVSVSHPP